MSTHTLASMSKREYFAARAMQGLICVGQGRWPLRDDCLELAKRSVMCADALIVELARQRT